MIDSCALLALFATCFKDGLVFSFFKGVRLTYKVIVGGAPVSREYAQEVGADGYAEDANKAVELAKTLMEA